ncbi:Hypothetical predicted protein [Paramuricea clavata]|uniref:Uncharacterized protein n=1 Tax=Paramuricea clavata TaxID=317549 RepID=A0A6S7JWC4_PARCT|nr:Hypothetical predicted protein [Paramuricea clavata]
MARRLERFALTEVRYKLHLSYLHQCKDAKSLPSFLQSRPPIDHPKAWKITEKAGWAYLRVLIGNCHNNLRNINVESTELNEKIKKILDENTLGMLKTTISNRCIYEKNKISKRHERKFTKVQGKDKKHEQAQKRWVINNSDRALNCHEITLLRKGMNFAITPKRIPIKNIVASVEQGIKNLDADKKNRVRENVCSVIKNARHPSNSNLSRQEEIALKDLRSDKNILVTKADKGNAMVVMNQVDYKNQVETMLQDEIVYKRITDKRRNPTSKTDTELQERLLKLKDTGFLTDNEYKTLRPFDSYPAAFYGLPKIHKVPLVEQNDHFTIEADTVVPLRPINSSIGSPT